MKVKIVVLITLLIFCIMFLWGLYQKTNYTNLNETSEPLYKFEIGILPDSISENQFELMYENLETQPIILAVTCKTDYNFLYSCAIQKVEIVKVFTGKGLSNGDEIWILMSKLIGDLKDTEAFINNKPVINMGFTNQMNVGSTYLVFLSSNLKYSEEAVYMFSEDYLMNTVFCYDDISNIPLTTDYEGAYFISYEKASNNEVFLESQDSIDEYETLKQQLFEKYSIIS